MSTSRLLPALLLALMACGEAPQALPTEVEVAEADAITDAAADPALVQLLYDYAFLPEVQDRQQRVRIRIWLRHMDLSRYQLEALVEAHQGADEERVRAEDAHAEIVASYEPQVGAVYDKLWDALDEGRPLDDPALVDVAAPLLDARPDKTQEKELLTLRVQSIQAVFGLAQDFLRSLSPMQESKLEDALFFLRHRLDPYANPGDFRVMVGTIFSPGEYGTLTRGSFDPEQDHLDLGRLWTDEDKAGAPIFNQLRREQLMYMVLLEPMLAVAAEAELAQSPDDVAPGAGEAPPPGEPRSPSPGVPDAPPVGVPDEPSPGAP